MSAFSHTDWTVTCDWRNGEDFCTAQERTDTLSASVLTARDVRRVLRQLGWAVNLPSGPKVGRVPRRLDFCPAHKQEAGTP